VLDTRSPEVFASGHLRGSLNVGLDGRFAEYAGDVLHAEDTVVLVAERGRETEAKVRLARIGYDHVEGFVPDAELDLVVRPDLAETAIRLPAADVASWRAEDPSLQFVDVRTPSEQETGIVAGAHLVPLPELVERAGELDPRATTVLYCAGGYRSSVAASVLRARGFTRVAEIIGGCDGWRATGLPLVESVLGAPRG